ncbi:sigma-54-dependent transcriptional regulator [Vulgatibacter sp.]|uniref:sigma-54-dependent transcriptional regulator n=1 Tax=Vulgatibacter sp. TaxID=1971226 RepID=UPI003562D5E7
MAATVLVVDDERNILLTFGQALRLAGHATETASSGKEALERLLARPIDVVLLDVKLPDEDGLQILQQIRKTRKGIPIVMMSGHGTIDVAVQAVRLGALDFLEKPVAKERLLVAVENALRHKAMADELDELRAARGTFDMVGGGRQMSALFDRLRRAAPSEGRVLITGENGTGKELIARAIHENSRRKDGPFVKLNCAAVPAELIESELFGHERGAFTGAHAARKGKFELADKGTLFLDEVGDMPAAMQAKLLRVLQEGEFERVGGTSTLTADVRVIAATNKDLPKEIEEGRFREDLYYRLNVVPIHAPPLRERKEDIPALVASFVREACERNGRRQMEASPEAMAALQLHDYPGNVRELRNLVERLVILSDGPVLGAADVAMALPGARKAKSGGYREGASFNELVEEAEREILLGALAVHGDSPTEASRALGMDRGHLYKKLKALGVKRGGGEA